MLLRWLCEMTELCRETRNPRFRGLSRQVFREHDGKDLRWLSSRHFSADIGAGSAQALGAAGLRLGDAAESILFDGTWLVWWRAVRIIKFVQVTSWSRRDQGGACLSPSWCGVLLGQSGQVL